MDYAEQASVLGDGEWRTPLSRYALTNRNCLAHCIGYWCGAQCRLRPTGRAAPSRPGAATFSELDYRVNLPLADHDSVDIDPAHPSLRRKRHELRVERRHFAGTQAVFLLGQHHNRTAFGGLVGQRGELRRIGKLALLDTGKRNELGGLTVAECDRAGLVE